jgi:N-acetylmuramoyl-L-alanine amidase
MRTTFNYSPNFETTKRKLNQIKFIILHYTGMKKESDSIKRLIDIKSKVSCHYLVKINGEIVVMVPDLYEAWHAGVSSWKNYKFLNKHSIGIEISNPGHDYNYKKFTKKQIQSLKRLSQFLIKKYTINQKNILGHSDIAPTRKKDPGEKFPWKYFAKLGIGKWHSLSKRTLIQCRRKKISLIDKKKFFKNLSKIGYSIKTPAKLKKDQFLNLITIAFQRRFRQELINGKIDYECLIISQNLVKKFN